jgi:hypothetical protein
MAKAQEKNEDQLELDIQIEEDKPEKEEVVQEVVTEEGKPQQEVSESEGDQEDEHEEYSIGVKKRIDKLTYKMREAERREQEAMEFAKSVKQENESLKKKDEEKSKNLFSEYENRVTLQLKDAKDELKKAYESGDSDGLADAQALVAKLAVEEENIKREVKKREKPSDETQQSKPQQPAKMPSPPPAPDPKAAEWASNNAWFGTDEPMTFTAFSIHRNLVEKENYNPTTDEYYKEVDKRMRDAFPHKFEDAQPNTGATKKVAQTVAPAARAVKSGRKTVKLNQRQVDMARRLGVPLEEYAKHVNMENV